MQIQSDQGFQTHSQGVITAPEAERLVEGLVKFELKDFGSKKWLKQHEALEQLNIQAHHNIVTNTDPFVLEALLSFDKMPVVIHDLLLTELWKERVMPVVEKDMASSESVKAYLYMYHEATVINLLEVLFFHQSSCDNTGESILDLAEYCYRKVTLLNSSPRLNRPEKLDKDKALDTSAERTWKTQKEGIQYKVAMAAVTVLRFLTDHMSKIQLALPLMTRLLENQDIVHALITLLERAPWVHRSKGQFMKWHDGQWTEWKMSEARKLCKVEAQVWLALHNLMLDPEARRKYHLTEQKKDTILKLRGHFNELLFDQVPPLAELARAVEEVNMMQLPEASALQAVTIEEMPQARADLEKDVDWNQLVTNARSFMSVSNEERQEEMQRFAAMYHIDNFDDLLEQPRCACCGKNAVKRCSRCSSEWYCGRECQVKAWAKHKPMCEVLSMEKKNRESAAGAAK